MRCRVERAGERVRDKDKSRFENIWEGGNNQTKMKNVRREGRVCQCQALTGRDSRSLELFETKNSGGGQTACT